MTLPTLRLLPVAGGGRGRGRGIAATRSRPWIYANEVDMAAARQLPAGAQVTLCDAGGAPLGSGFVTSQSLIAVRLYAAEANLPFDGDLLRERLQRAIALRRRLGLWPHCRIVHAEADGLPALVIDRIGETAVVQVNGAGMDRMRDDIVAAIAELADLSTVILRGDETARQREGLEPLSAQAARGRVEGPVELTENGIFFRADPLGGQKTGWYHDQRENRIRIGTLARDLTVLDLYCHSGGFALHAAAGGASNVIAIDSSAPALDLAKAAATANRLDGQVAFQRQEAFRALAGLAEDGQRFGLVIADPPPFARSRKDVPTATKAYRKLARLTAERVLPGGFLFIASCSHAIETARFAEEVWRGLQQAGRSGRILTAGGAAADHPVHPGLPETAYLKSLLLQLD
ncbi:MAG: class I SAM-dependent rRNA methyltransferase [Sneathiellaceae bacterium]